MPSYIFITVKKQWDMQVSKTNISQKLFYLTIIIAENKSSLSEGHHFLLHKIRIQSILAKYHKLVVLKFSS